MNGARIVAALQDAVDGNLASVFIAGTWWIRKPEWRDMTSAPKDGTTVLGIVDGFIRLMQWCKTSHVPLYDWNLADQGIEDFELCRPTHWMPLPDPPGAG